MVWQHKKYIILLKVTSLYKIKFINHACMMIEDEKHAILVDPWFTGKVFNDSWSLLRDTDLSLINFDKLSHIFISHEHPDHLHWATLKKIQEYSNKQIFVVSIKRENKNIKEAVQKIGFKHAELLAGRRTKITDRLWVSQFPTGHDSAFVFEADDKVILNQNDCKLSREQCFLIKQKYKKIDLWLMQFGLAGYYANSNDKQGLKDAKQKHINLINTYYDFFKPSCFVPFASYVYFCKKYNYFLNEWQVTPAEISERCVMPTQFVFYGDEILYENYESKNDENIIKWSDTYDSKKEILAPKKIDNVEIIKAFKNFTFGNDYSVPEKFYIELFDNDKIFLCDLKNKNYNFIHTSEKAIVRTSMEELLCFVKYPWGADTLNITSCFDMLDKQKFKNVLMWKDSLYKR